MLARVVENVYWLSRYLERAENTARIIGVNTNLLLDLPGGIAPGWLPLVDISGNRAEFDELHDGKATRGEERDVVQFLIADKNNPGSICSSLHSARENARTLREILPTEAWELLNEFIRRMHARTVDGAINKRTRFEFLKRIVVTLQTIAGMLDGTMNRNDAYTFSLLGRNLERADMTSRIVDVRSAQLLPAETPGAAALRDRAVDERAEEPVRLPDVPAAHAHPREAHRRAPVPAARRPVPALLPVLPHAARTLAQRPAAQRGRARGAGGRRALHRARAARDARSARVCTSSSTSLQLHINNVHDMIAGSLLSVATWAIRGACQPGQRRSSRSGRHVVVRRSRSSQALRRETAPPRGADITGRIAAIRLIRT